MSWQFGPQCEMTARDGGLGIQRFGVLMDGSSKAPPLRRHAPPRFVNGSYDVVIIMLGTNDAHTVREHDHVREVLPGYQ